jgi:hypothetical protein
VSSAELTALLQEGAVLEKSLPWLPKAVDLDNARQVGLFESSPDDTLPVEIPSHRIVRLPDMNSANDMGNKDKGYIRKLAGGTALGRLMRQKTGNLPELPTVSGTASVYRQPNGEYFVVLDSNGAHTARAAQIRGGEAVKFYGVVAINELPEDVYSLDQQLISANK